MSPEEAAAASGVEPDGIQEAARLLWHHRPVAHYTWTGLEQHTNATQTDRAIAILHALTGSIDVPGGNVHFAQVPVNDVSGVEFRDPKQMAKSAWLERATAWTRSTGMDYLDGSLSCGSRQAALSGARACRFRGQSAAIAR